MIKLTDILNEITVIPPLPHIFKNDDELANYLRKYPSYKKKLIDNIVNSPKLGINVYSEWDDVMNKWYNAEIKQYTDINNRDEILLDDGQGNRLYISTDPLGSNPDADMYTYEVEFGPNVIYFQIL